MSIFSKLLDIVKWGGTNLTGRDISNDIKTLSDDTVKGILRSLGDAGASPTNASGSTLLQRIADLKNAPPKLPSGAVQIAKYGSANNTITIIHTVSAGKTLYLNSAVAEAYNNSGAAAAHILFVRDTADAEVYKISNKSAFNGQAWSVAITFPVPLEVPEGYDICVQTTVSGATSWAFIHGWEE